MSSYDSAALKRSADRMHRQAKVAVFGGIAAGILTGSLFGYAATLMFASPHLLVFPGAIVGAITGIVMGRQRALGLRLQAETAYCLIEIEKNSRTTTPS